MKLLAWWDRKRAPEAHTPVQRRKGKIRRDALDLICESAKSQHPHEFGGLLRVEKGVITEIILLPGTISGETHAIFQLGMMPVDFSVKGTVHSHPGSVPRPSGADLELFRKYGSMHIIIAEPYTPQTWRAYDGRGDPMDMEVVTESQA